ncbi:hypothetical protein ACA910_000889 [Epithemia clementina (nom. ined.)]
MGKAKIDIVLEQHVQAGSWMKGYVLMNIEGGSVRANALKLTFRGHEHTEIVYQETEDEEDENSNRRTRTVNRTETSKRSLIDVNLPVGDTGHKNSSLTFIDNSGNIRPGQYQIPFEVEVPKFLPGSMVFESSCGSRCSVLYELEAVLKGSGVLWNYHKAIPVQVLAKPMDALPPSPHIAAPVNERVNICCCFNKGSVSLGGKVDETRLSAGSRCCVSLSCRNYSTADTERVEARLRQNITWKASGRSKTSSENLVTVQFPSMLDNIRRRHVTGGHDQSHELLVRDEMQDMFREINDGSHSGIIIIPPTVLDTYSGHLIMVSHRIELEVKTGCCISDPSIYIPIWIGQPSSETSEVYALPPSTLLPGFVQAPAIVVPDSDIYPVIHIPSSSVFPVASAPTEYVVVEPDIGIGPSPEVPSFDLLMREMKGTVSHLDLIERKIRDPDWAPIWQRMTPAEFGKFVGRVELGFDQPRVAKAVAEEIPSFRCEFVVAALQYAMDYQRTSMVEQLLPYCTDLAENKTLIEKQLTEWERLVTESSFAHALACR